MYKVESGICECHFHHMVWTPYIEEHLECTRLVATDDLLYLLTFPATSWSNILLSCMYKWVKLCLTKCRSELPPFLKMCDVIF